MSRPERVAPAGRGRLPGLDGVRGLAVVAVLLFHSGFGWARGGFLGVTVFFALSGFLITWLLLVERQQTGRIDLKRFWGRRARRLVPAFLVLFALVVLYVAVTGDGGPGVNGDGLAAAAWLSNWRFIATGRSYEALFAQPSPFLHTWSLAIEEQFYVVLPVAALVLLGRSGPGRRRRFALAVGAAAVLSTVAATLLHPAGSAPLRAYYGADTRAAEPLIGVLLALVLVGRTGIRRLGPAGRRRLDALAVVALLGLGAMVATTPQNSDALYRGGFAVAAILSSIVVAAATQPGRMARWLSWTPLAVLGRVSYGVYLFHWPVFLWLSPARTGLDPWPLLAARSTVVLAMAVASYAFVERPVRAGRVPVRIGLVGWANAAVALVAGLLLANGLVAAPDSGTMLFASPSAQIAPPPTSPPPPAPATASAVGAPVATTAASAAPRLSSPRAATTPKTSAPTAGPKLVGGGGQPTAPEAPPTTAPPSSSSSTVSPGPRPRRIAVVGDSLALDLGQALMNWANERDDVVAYDLSIRACPISRGGTRRFPDGTDWPVYESCGWWSDSGSTRAGYLADFAPDLVFVQDSMNLVPDRKLPDWRAYRHPGEPLFDAWLVSEYRAARAAFARAGASVVVVGNALCANWPQLERWRDIEDAEQRVDSLNVDYEALGLDDNVEVLDLAARLCPSGKFSNTVEGVEDGRPDGYHLSAKAAAALVDRWLGPELLARAAATP